MNNSPIANRMGNVIASSARLSLNRTRKVFAAILVFSVLLFGIQISRAGSAQWATTPNTGDWNTATNWTPGTVPNSSADTATFGFSSINNVSISANTEVNSLAFSIGGSTAYTIAVSPTFTLRISGAGISNNSGVTQTFITALGSNGAIRFSNNATAGSLSAFTNVGVTRFLDSSTADHGTFTNTGAVDFEDTSTAGNGIFVNKGSTVCAGNGSFESFYDNSTAGNGIFTNEGGAVIGAGGGHTDFDGNSNAGNATFTNNGSSTSGDPCEFGAAETSGTVRFFENSSAGSGTFIMDGGDAVGSVGGLTNFFDNSTAANGNFTMNGAKVIGATGGLTFFLSGTAGNGTFINNGSAFINEGGVGTTMFFGGSAGSATLIANGGISGGDGGIIQFDSGVGGTARVKVFGNGKLEISPHDAPGLTVGSIEGDGDVFLGDNNLNVGSNNLSTTFSGVVHDGGFYSNIGGSLTKTGTGTLTLSGNNIYSGGTEIQNGRLIVNNTSGSGTGSGPVIVDNGAILGGSGTIQLGAGASLTNNGIIAPGSSAGQLNVAGDIQLNYSSNLSFEIGGTTPATQYDVLNKTDAGALILNGKLTVTLINGFTPQSSDTFTIVTTQTTLGSALTNVKSGGRINTADSAGSFQVTYNGVNNVTLSDFGAALTPSRSRNISARANVQTGDNVAIGGFVIKGTDPKKVIVRGIGPSLQNFGVQNPLSNPTLELHNQSGVIANNDDWKDSQQAEIQNSGFAPGNELESAIVATLQPGSYSVILSGKDNGTGTGLIEIYDLDPAANAKLANLSTRALVGTGDDVLIGGINVGPNNANSSTLLVRALGPSLQPFGVQNFLADPVLELHDAQGNLFALNDNWKDTQQTDITATHFSPTNDAESAILMTLAPGAWTAVVRGAGDTSGVALIEVYRFQ